MKHNIVQDGVALFGKSDKGGVCITFLDACYVRSDAIIVDRADLSVHAVLHESSHFVGYVDGDVVDSLVDDEEITLIAPHCAGGIVHLKSRLSLV